MLLLYFCFLKHLLLYCCSFTCCYKLAVDVVDAFHLTCESGTRLKQNCLKMAFMFHIDRRLSWCFCAVCRGRGSSTLKESATCFVEWVLRVLHPPLETKSEELQTSATVMGMTDACVPAVHLHFPANAHAQHWSGFLTMGIFLCPI